MIRRAAPPFLLFLLFRLLRSRLLFSLLRKKLKHHGNRRRHYPQYNYD